MKQTELERKTPLRRKTPIARKPPKTFRKVSKRIPKKKPAVAAAQHAQYRFLNIRSGGRCEMEVPSPIPGDWMRCSKFGRDPAHIYSRPKCGVARDMVDAVIHACRRCHDASKGKLGTELARIPLRRAQVAWDVILAYSKLGTDDEDRLRIHIGSLGPRPEKGMPPYD